MADESDHEDRIKELERLVDFLRKQLPIHADNTQRALESHKGAMAAHNEMSETFRDLKTKLNSIEGRVIDLEKAGR